MNKLLEKVAVNRLVREIAKGNVSVPLVNLVNKGALRSENRYLKGTILGNRSLGVNENVIFQRARYPEEIAYTKSTGSAAGFPNLSEKGGKVAFSKGMDKSDLQAKIRHEILELQESNLIRDTVEAVPDAGLKRYLESGVTAPVFLGQHRLSPNTGVLPHVMIGPDRTMAVGRHSSLAVLTNESNLVRSNPYLTKLRSFRKDSGESKLIEKVTGKKFGIDKMTKKDHTLARNYPANEVLQGYVPVRFYKTES